MPINLLGILIVIGTLSFQKLYFIQTIKKSAKNEVKEVSAGIYF